jgi:uncharacterized membrane protein YkoI
MNALSVSIGFILLAAARASAQASYKRDIPDSLAKQAKVSESAAAATAQRRVPKGKIEGVELERDNGKLIFSYDIKTPGKAGIDEVNVDAGTGKIIGVGHESAAAEKREAAAEAKANKKAAAKKP